MITLNAARGITRMSREMTITIAAIAGLTLWNITVFALYGMDKRKAKAGKWRISETTLIICAFLMGGIGAFLGMKVFRHKTKHLKFKLLIPLAVIVNIAAVIAFLYFMGVFA
jgi:uncharacterized membrane protein YsdA (DUF1294 family)